MNLVQKMPIGLGLACLLMLSSCSKEDVSAPQPQVARVLSPTEANLKVRGPVIPSSQGPVTGNINSYSSLTDWYAQNPSAAGVSNYKNVLGDVSTPWENALPLFFPGPSTFVTLKATKIDRAWSITLMRGLTPGKKYKVTFSLSTSKPLGSQMVYAETANVKVSNSTTPDFKKLINLVGKEGEWVTESMIFVAKSDDASLEIISSPESYNVSAYLNVLITQNALQQLD